MSTQDVVLTDHQKRFVGELVATGRYRNASEVLRDALRLLEHQYQQQGTTLAEVRAGIIEGLDQIERGEFADGATGEESVKIAFDRAMARRQGA